MLVILWFFQVTSVVERISPPVFRRTLCSENLNPLRYAGKEDPFP
jgi:hypothetical protein